ncbi:hypothetical protein [Streptomyces sp. NPDC101455]|uniref:hypothetical protein n=1 Tax=Streptomyces sp. NPDC101455 TaxID=3366142 RepID=UPI003815061A
MSAYGVTAGASGDVTPDGPVITIVNEFAEIRVQKVYTRNGERLRIASYRRGSATDLDAIQLESLTWQSPEDFSRLLTSSIGPDDTSGTGATASKGTP